VIRRTSKDSNLKSKIHNLKFGCGFAALWEYNNWTAINALQSCGGKQGN